ncbi:hypothetical protein DFP72DRAFT_872306 [Ephemerocybe angulata]|uniref:Myotrophin n=1 Tax=Ephemerocybe angulata TaxID=980116 RepID=A0A8H6IFQ4_9AGAR|nr:hypothetical protein DFP72DRAFT_872306 [Tulosesus angulatus]
MLLLFMPLRDLIETILARRTKQRQKDLDMALGSAINAGDRSMVLTWLARGANLNAKLDGDMTAIQLACSINAVDIIKALLDAGADPNIQNGPSRGAYAVGEDNKICLRLLKHVEDRTLGLSASGILTPDIKN